MSEKRDLMGSRLESLLTAPAQSQARWPDLAAAVGLVLVFGLSGGPLGAIAGLGTIAVWYIFGTAYAIAIGHLLLVPLFPAGIDPGVLALLESGFVALLIVPAIRTREPLGVASVTLGAGVAVSGLAWLTLQSQPLWVGAAVTVGVLVLAHYGLYRYGLVSFGLVDNAADRAETADSQDI